MQKLISIDPSLRGTGIAWWLDGKLVDTGLYAAKTSGGRRNWGHLAREIYEQVTGGAQHAPWPTHVVCEIPQIYKQSPGDPNDLVAISLVAGALCSAWESADVTTVWPADWKGQVPKKIHHPRVLGALSGIELQVIDDAKRRTGAGFHNVMDAVGLGLWHLKKAGLR